MAAWRYELYFLVAKTIFYSLAALVYKILFRHSKIKFISSCHRVISSIYMLHLERFFLPCSCFRSFIGDIHKSWRSHFVDKTAKQFFPPKLTPGAKHQLKYNVQRDWSNQIITVYLIGQFKPWSDIISFHCSEMISYHFTGTIFNLVMALSHWYPHDM